MNLVCEIWAYLQEFKAVVVCRVPDGKARLISLNSRLETKEYVTN